MAFGILIEYFIEEYDTQIATAAYNALPKYHTLWEINNRNTLPPRLGV